MQPTCLRRSLNLPILRTALSFFLIFTLIACGANASPTSSPQTGTATASPTCSTASLQPTPFTAFHANPTNICVKAGDLLIQSDTGFQCPNEGQIAGVIPMDQLVLTSDRTTYSKTEITQMKAYLSRHNNVSLTGLPSTLQWLLGGATTPISWMTGGEGCDATFMLTNTGNTLIQIAKVGVQLEAPPQPNSYQYRLIDYCSLISLSCPPTSGGGPGDGCSAYYDASIQLGFGKKNDVFSADLNDIDGCGTLTLDPAQQFMLDVSFSSKKVPDNLIYSFLPMFTIITSQGVQNVSLPQIKLAFADAKQFSCYGLHGTTFVLIPSPTLMLPAYHPGNWCM